MRRYRWGNQYQLGQFVFLAVRDALYSPAHPDSKRQDRRKARDLARYGARILKRSGVVTCPVKKTNRRKELKEIQWKLKMEQRKFANSIADRLRGRKRAA